MEIFFNKYPPKLYKLCSTSSDRFKKYPFDKKTTSVQYSVNLFYILIVNYFYY